MNEVCELLNIHKNTLYKWIEDGKIEYFKVGKIYRFEEPDIKKFIEKQKGK